MDEKLFLEQLHEVFESDDGAITGSSCLEKIDGWDSLTFLGLIAMVDEEYGVTLAPTQVLACETVADLMQVVCRARSDRQAA